ncbi:MAG: DUF6502 family protein [Gammaproteobacteria bacterium]|jgi:hypothetical protein
MDTAFINAISAAIVRLLRPLIRILLRNGISYNAFADLAKWVYVDVASKEFTVPGRKQSVSRISVITGLTRKEVARVKSITVPSDTDEAAQYNRASRVIGGWLRDRRFSPQDGLAAPLPFDGVGGFNELVRTYSGDMTARAMLDELLRAGAVSRDQHGAIHLLASGYIPKDSDPAKLNILGSDVALLIGTIDHNLQISEEPPRFQRKVAYDNLPVEALPKLRKFTQERAQAVLEEVNRYLSQQDRDINPSMQGSARKNAGIGIYYFEEDVPEENENGNS